MGSGAEAGFWRLCSRGRLCLLVDRGPLQADGPVAAAHTLMEPGRWDVAPRWPGTAWLAAQCPKAPLVPWVVWEPARCPSVSQAGWRCRYPEGAFAGVSGLRHAPKACGVRRGKDPPPLSALLVSLSMPLGKHVATPPPRPRCPTPSLCRRHSSDFDRVWAPGGEFCFLELKGQALVRFQPWHVAGLQEDPLGFGRGFG